jgi:hypothetical protein
MKTVVMAAFSRSKGFVEGRRGPLAVDAGVRLAPDAAMR